MKLMKDADFFRRNYPSAKFNSGTVSVHVVFFLRKSFTKIRQYAQ